MRIINDREMLTPLIKNIVSRRFLKKKKKKSVEKCSVHDNFEELTKCFRMAVLSSKQARQEIYFLKLLRDIVLVFEWKPVTIHCICSMNTVHASDHSQSDTPEQHNI